MSFWGVTVEEIDMIEPIKGADRIVVATLKGMGYKFVIGKDAFKPGDEVLYFPLDSLLPPKLIEAMGLTGKLSGKDKNRVKTVKLRKQISQGIVGKMDLIPYCVQCDMDLEDESILRTPEFSEYLTAELGVIKYEAPVSSEGNVTLKGLPHGMSVYGLENAERFPDLLEQLMAQEVVDITEKLEGTNISVMVKGDEVFVNSHRRGLFEKEEDASVYWRTAREQGLIKQVQKMAKGKDEVIVFGEMIGPGIQGNIYKLPGPKIYVYDAKIDGEWVQPGKFRHMIRDNMSLDCAIGYGCAPVPWENPQSLADFLKGRTLAEASNGMSQLNNQVRREGYVIRAWTGERVILKQRSPMYLEAEED